MTKKRGKRLVQALLIPALWLLCTHVRTAAQEKSDGAGQPIPNRQAYELPAEPILFLTSPSNSGLSLEPTNPKPIVGRFVIACVNSTFVCSDNGGEFHACAHWELADVGLKNPRFANGKCVAAKQ